MAQWLIEKGADNYSRGSEGNTALHMIAAPGYNASVVVDLDGWKESLNMVKWLIEEKRVDDINVQNDHGETILLSFIKSGDLENIQWLIDKGANINLQTKSGNILHWAVTSRKLEIVQFLVNHFKSIRSNNKDTFKDVVENCGNPLSYIAISTILNFDNVCQILIFLISSLVNRHTLRRATLPSLLPFRLPR